MDLWDRLVLTQVNKGHKAHKESRAMRAREEQKVRLVLWERKVHKDRLVPYHRWLRLSRSGRVPIILTHLRPLSLPVLLVVLRAGDMQSSLLIRA